jgi:hypothetical protein
LGWIKAGFFQVDSVFIKLLAPMIFMIRFKLSASTCKLISALTRSFMDSRGAAEGLWEASDFVELARSVENVETHIASEVEKQVPLQKP